MYDGMASDIWACGIMLCACPPACCPLHSRSLHGFAEGMWERDTKQNAHKHKHNKNTTQHTHSQSTRRGGVPTAMPFQLPGVRNYFAYVKSFSIESSTGFEQT